MIMADRDEVIPILDYAVARGRQHGAISNLVGAYIFSRLPSFGKETSPKPNPMRDLHVQELTQLE